MLDKNELIAEVKNLKQEESIILNANNELVHRIWELDIQLNAAGATECSKHHFEALKKELQNEFISKGYPEKIKTLRNKIEALEIAVYGSSKINNHSPIEDTRHKSFMP